jgi:hypothetical protein
VVIAAANATTNANNMTAISQRFLVFNDLSSAASLVGQFDVNGTFPQFMPYIPYLASPQLTKLGVTFPSNNNASNLSSPSMVMLLKSVDYAASSLSNLTFQDINHYQTTVQNLRPDNKDFYFGDIYYVIRNASAGNASGQPNISFVEEAYQFVGSQVVYLRNRLLNGKELTDFKRMWVDTTFTNQLAVLDAYNVTGGLEVDQFLYGSLASINKVVPPTTPPYITFQIPAHTSQFIPMDSLTWVYLNSNSSNTDYTIFTADAKSPNNLKAVNSSAMGSVQVLAMSNNCFLFIDTTNNTVKVATAPPANGTNSSSSANSSNSSSPFVYEDVTPLIANLSVTNHSRWTVSQRCDRFGVDGKVFFRTQNSSHFMPVPNNVTVFSPSAMDRDLSAAIVNSSIWLLNPNTSTYWKAFDSPIPFLPNNSINVFNNQVVVTATNSTSAQVQAFFIEDNGNFTNCLNYNFPMYQSFPKIQLSEQFTKVLIMGAFIPPNQTQTQPKIDAFFINYPNRTFQNISLNLNLPADPSSVFILLDEKYLYTRSLLPPNASNSSNSSNSLMPQEVIFYFDQDITPKMAKSTNLTQDQVTSWKRTVFAPVSDGSINIFVESVGGNATDQVIVNMLQVTPQQANLNSNPNSGQPVVVNVVDNRTSLCSVGCSDCSSGTCAGCVDRFAFDSASTTCVRCATNCRTCSSSDASVCSSCLQFSYLSNSSSCLPCDRSCVTCLGSATNCSSCPPGQSLSGGSCSGTCPRNCISCLNSTSCTTCIRGFVAVNGSCRGCSITCSNCSATNITACTSCAPGLSLVNSACVSCPDKCLTCNNGICTTCIPGYTPNSAGTCVLMCEISCATCADNQPSTCLSCYYPGVLVGTTCQLNTTCNADSSCTDCGQGLGYVLVGATCQQCNSISNCLQCDSSNACAICLNGFYINSTGLCASCSAGCNVCLSSTICSACAIGYTLPYGQTQGQCLQCTSPCASCSGVATSCTSCLSGYTLTGWKCQNNTYVNFKIILLDSPENILGNVDSVTTGILSACGLNTSNTNAVTYESIKNGSTAVSGVVSDDSTSPSVIAASLSASVASGSIAGISVGSSSSISVTGSSSSDSQPNTGLIAGLVVGLTVLLVVVIVIGYVIYKRRKSPTQPLRSNDGDIIIEVSNQEGISQQRNE